MSHMLALTVLTLALNPVLRYALRTLSFFFYIPYYNLSSLLLHYHIIYSLEHIYTIILSIYFFLINIILLIT
ncbi:hypothetical protein EDC94DRAFT_605125 [Helicostylum pulchrum]|nr:hypothetical protein EDC94DRAFT_605125 [Helicostylum pulchrum]